MQQQQQQPYYTGNFVASQPQVNSANIAAEAPNNEDQVNEEENQ